MNSLNKTISEASLQRDTKDMFAYQTSSASYMVSKRRSKAVDTIGAWLYKMLMGAFVIAMVFACVLGVNWVNRPINEVSFSGKFTYLDQRTLQQQMNGFSGQRIFSISLQKIEHKLMQLPWVEKAVIKRQWPGKLDIYIIERLAIAVWKENLKTNCERIESCGFIQADGMIIHSEKIDKIRSLISLVASKDDAKKISQWYPHFYYQLKEQGQKIEALILSEYGHWTLVLSTGIKIKLGKERILEKLSRVLLIWSKRLVNLSSQIESIDARYPDGIAVLWKETNSEKQKRNI